MHGTFEMFMKYPLNQIYVVCLSMSELRKKLLDRFNRNFTDLKISEEI